MVVGGRVHSVVIPGGALAEKPGVHCDESELDLGYQNGPLAPREWTRLLPVLLQPRAVVDIPLLEVGIGPARSLSAQKQRAASGSH